MIRWEVPIDLVVHITVVLFLIQLGLELSAHGTTDHILCNFDDNLSLESVLGNESISTSGEIIRVSELSLTEII